jgi:hypothetical protein
MGAGLGVGGEMRGAGAERGRGDGTEQDQRRRERAPPHPLSQYTHDAGVKSMKEAARKSMNAVKSAEVKQLDFDDRFANTKMFKNLDMTTWFVAFKDRGLEEIYKKHMNKVRLTAPPARVSCPPQAYPPIPKSSLGHVSREALLRACLQLPSLHFRGRLRPRRTSSHVPSARLPRLRGGDELDPGIHHELRGAPQ